MEKITTSKYKFFEYLKSYDNLENVRFKYDENCTDPYSMRSPYHLRRSASYVLYLNKVDEKNGDYIVLESSWHRRTHEQKKEELLKRYEGYIQEYKSKYFRP